MDCLLQIIPMPTPIGGGGGSMEFGIAILLLLGALLFLPSLIWCIIDYAIARKKYGRCFHDWWYLDAPTLPQGAAVVGLVVAFAILVIYIAQKLEPLLL